MITKEKQEMLKYYNLGLAAYKQKKWDDAIKAFEMALKIVPDDGPSKLYLQRSSEYRLNPPGEDWDGVFVMTTK
ncbi:MAG TPA: tetratricopeptide repeat protein [Spirochaetota bacterium]|nr:tetratricopeptide repeat protein [Spirochaetota bacterium]HPI88720.1 tetratricopeptide repeat protein [Spirochaetota bacterium]HPR48758.1 tetratricopeptide repeat protein [Spirochaetota bacterium]